MPALMRYPMLALLQGGSSLAQAQRKTIHTIAALSSPHLFLRLPREIYSPAACCSRSVFGRVASTRLGADFVSATSSHDAAWQLATDVRAVDSVVTAWWAVAVTRGSLAFGVVTATVAADSSVTSVSLLVGLLSGPFNKRGCSGGLEQSRWSVRRSGEHSEPAAATILVR